VTTTTSPPLTTLAGIDGGLVYLSHCAACHGINRQGVITGANLVGPPVAPANLSGFTDAALSAFSVVHLKSKTNVDLPAAQANNLAIFMKTVPPATTTPPPTTTPPATTPATTPPATTSAVNAAQLYANSCAVCHGANRQGVIVGTTVLGPPVLVTSPSVASRTEAQLTSYILTHQTGALLDPDQRAALVKMLKAP
jgi:mono/diheme cytochrome c family protein